MSVLTCTNFSLCYLENTADNYFGDFVCNLNLCNFLFQSKLLIMIVLSASQFNIHSPSELLQSLFSDETESGTDNLDKILCYSEIQRGSRMMVYGSFELSKFCTIMTAGLIRWRQATII